MIGKINDRIRARVWEFFQPYTLGTQSPCQMMIGVYSHLLRKVFSFHYHSQKVIGSLGIWYCSKKFARHKLDILLMELKNPPVEGKVVEIPLFTRCFTSPVVQEFFHQQYHPTGTMTPWYSIDTPFRSIHGTDILTTFCRKNQPKVHIPVPWILWVLYLFLVSDVSLNVILGPFCRLNSNHRLWGFQQIWSQINENPMVVSTFLLIDRFQNLSPNKTRGRRGHPQKIPQTTPHQPLKINLGCKWNSYNSQFPNLTFQQTFTEIWGVTTRDGFLPRAFRTSGSALASKRSCTKCGRPKKQAKPQVWIPFWVTRVVLVCVIM